MTAKGLNGINVQNNPINFIDPYGLELYGAANAGFLGATYTTTTQNLSQAALSTGDGVIVAGSLSIGWDFGNGALGETNHEILGDTLVSIGLLGKFLGLSFAPDFSKVQINVGFGLALPVSLAVPIIDENLEPIDATFGDELYDILHSDKSECK